MVHKCDRDSCPTVNVNGPKTKCVKCLNPCFLKCFGFEKGEKVEGIETVKWKFGGGIVIAFLPTLAFACCTDSFASIEPKTVLKMPTARATSKTRQQKLTETNDSVVVTELSKIKEMLSSIKQATDTNTADIAEIKNLSTKTEANVKKVTEQNAVHRLHMHETQTNQASTPSFAQALKARTNFETPNHYSAKRKRVENPMMNQKNAFTET